MLTGAAIKKAKPGEKDCDPARWSVTCSGRGGALVRALPLRSVARPEWPDLAEEDAACSGCSEAEILLRLVRRANKRVIISRELVAEVKRLGSNINQIARHLNRGGGVGVR
jgi:hypothetical protein